MKKNFVIQKKDVVIKILRDMTQLENQPVRNQPVIHIPPSSDTYRRRGRGESAN